MKTSFQRFSTRRNVPTSAQSVAVSASLSRPKTLAAITALAFFAGGAWAGNPGSCPAVKDADFTMTTLASQTANNLQEPMRMAFDLTPSGTDVYFVEKGGKVRKYVAATKTVTNIGTIGVNTTGEHGLLGIALDPGFKTNKRLFLFYGTNQNPYQFRLSRFTMTGEQLDMASEKIMIRISADAGSWHTGGSIKFDNAGDLWITVGDNKSDEGGSPNTNDLRGKILRIHPLEDGTYSIPAGNLFPVGTEKTKPEIYIMGDRNPYSIGVDPKTGWIVWGEVGPDGYGVTEEFNLATKPGNYGWPYFAGKNQVIKTGKVPSAPINNSPLNTGLVNLPPAVTATYAYQQDCAISGPVYRYDAYANTAVKMPPHFDGTWFVTDFNNYGTLGQTMDTMSVDANGNPGKLGRIWPNWKLTRPLEFQVGPDGAFYVVNYAGYFSTISTTAIVRIEYNGTCRPPVDNSIAIRRPMAPGGALMDVAGSRIAVRSELPSELKVTDMSGRSVFSQRTVGQQEFDLAPAVHGRAGLYAVTLATGSSVISRKVLLDGL
ncbi:MAG: cytochrome c class [Fibrobacteres bacterium]|nr:cytochrome c class [Fibrobacterota bacterium]